MRKKKKIKERIIKIDKKFSSPLVTQLINKIMRNGEKRKATKIVYDSAKIIEEKTSSSFLHILEGALENVKPGIEMKSRRVGGAKHRIPKEIKEKRSVKIALRWIVEGAKEKKTITPIYERLAEEINSAYNKSGEAFKKKENLQKEAETGKIFTR